MTRRRARDDDGKFLADDPATPAVNEAYEPVAPMADAEPVAAVAPEQRRTAVPDTIETPAGKIRMVQPALGLTGADLMDRYRDKFPVPPTDAEAQIAVEIAHKSLEAYVGGPIPPRPAPTEQAAILDTAFQAFVFGLCRPGRILREREIPASARGAVTYRLLGRRRPQLYNPQRIGGPVGGVSRLTR